MNLFYLVDFGILLVNEGGIKENRTGSAYNCIIQIHGRLNKWCRT